jgi:hypothetical protein
MPSRNDRRNDTGRSCAVCGARFVAIGRRHWCSGACRQKAWRRRHPTQASPATELAAAAPASRDNTVYECPDCETRYLGVQRCDDCGTFCRRIGRGAPCPHCDEPVAIADLITEAVTR